MECRTASISIPRPADAVYAFLADPANFPKWSAFLQTIRADGDTWLATTPAGTVRIRFTPFNAFRVLDHDVTPESGPTVHVPLRVLPNDGGSEVVFTVFRQPGMTDEQFEADLALVQADLRALQAYLERTGI